MLTDDEIKSLKPEQKAELIAKLTAVEPVVEPIIPTKLDGQPVVTPVVEQPVVEPQVEPIVEKPIEPVVEPQAPNFDEKFNAFEKRFADLETQLKQKDSTIATLQGKVDELIKTTPVGFNNPKPSDSTLEVAKDREEKMLQNFKKGYRNGQ